MKQRPPLTGDVDIAEMLNLATGDAVGTARSHGARGGIDDILDDADLLQTDDAGSPRLRQAERIALEPGCDRADDRRAVARSSAGFHVGSSAACGRDVLVLGLGLAPSCMIFREI